MDNESIIMGAFLGSGILAYVIIPSLSSCGTGFSTTWRTKERERKSKRQGSSPPPISLFMLN